MRHKYNRLKKVLIIFITSHLMLVGCSNENQKEEEKKTETPLEYKVVYIDENDTIELKEMTSVTNLPVQLQDNLSTIYSYNKSYSYEFISKEKNSTIYTCDPMNDETIKLKEFEGKAVTSFIEFEDAYIYAYLEEDGKMSVVQEKDGVVTTIVTASVFNESLFKPRFYVVDNQLLFLLTDTVVENDEKTTSIHQKFLSYKGGKLETLYKTDFTIIKNVFQAGAYQIKSQFLVQGDGKMIFQVGNGKTTILFKYHKGKITQQTIENTNYTIIGYLENSVIFKDNNNSKYVLYDLEKNTTIPIDYNDSMNNAMIYNNTVMYFNDKKNKLWALTLKEEGGYTLFNMDKIIYEKLNIKDPSSYTNFVFPMGNTILLTQSNYKKDPLYTFYSLKYEKN